MSDNTPTAPTFGPTHEVVPINGPVDAEVVVPGSKSITNRALPLAALAAGRSVIDGALFADDTEAMLGALAALSVEVEIDRERQRIVVDGGVDWATLAQGPTLVLHSAESGTASRFLTALAAIGHGPIVVDGFESIRVRPIADLLDALRDLGAAVTVDPTTGGLPVTVDGSAVQGRSVSIRGDASSQFLSALMMLGPVMPDGLELELASELVSRPYVEMTAAVMTAFNGHATVGDNSVSVASGGYRGANYTVEPDASAASYFFGAAAVLGGRVRIPGLGSTSLQGDLRFVDLLGEMGAEVASTESATEVLVTRPLVGIEVDLADCSDLVPTLAVVASQATSPSRFTGIGFIRHKESDRIGGVVAELQRCGIDAIEEDDGMVVHPGAVTPATIRTYGDHRMAMAFALLGLAHPGIVIADPGCVAKTFPTFFEALDQLR